MLTLTFYIIIIIFATSAILEAWFHEGGIFENIKNTLSLWCLKEEAEHPPARDYYYNESPPPVTHVVIIKNKSWALLAQLLNCRKCLTYWVSAGSCLLIFISTLSVYTIFIMYIFIILAIVRGVHIIDWFLTENDQA